MKRLVVFAVAALGLALPSTAPASHSWSNYHWGRTSQPFTLKLVDSVSSSWDSYLSKAVSDWSVPVVSGVPDVLNITKETGVVTKNCKGTSGKSQVCNGNYGYNGWLGLAQIWVSTSHITKAIAKMNDSYFSLSTYNKPAWKQHVVCQEVGHGFGLGHQDESGKSLGTCMDYATDPTNSQHPNKHDYDQLELIYNSHLDSTRTYASVAGGPGHGPPERISDNLWVEDLGNGIRRFTYVYWVEPGIVHGFPQVD